MFVQIGRYRDDDMEREEHIVIHNYDTWNMDHTLALIILPLLKQLKATKHGAPAVDYEDVPETLHPLNKEEASKLYSQYGETDSNYFKRWDYVLDEMIFSFTSKVDDSWEEEFFKDSTYFRPLEFKGVGPCQYRLFPDDNGSMEDYEYYELDKGEPTHAFDKNAYNKYQQRIANGFRLFGKYYQSLWD